MLLENCLTGWNSDAKFNHDNDISIRVMRTEKSKVNSRGENLFLRVENEMLFFLASANFIEKSKKIHQKIFLYLFPILLIWGIPTVSNGDVFQLQSGLSLDGIVLSETSTEIEIQTVSATIMLPLSRVSSWNREKNLQSYFRLSQDALAQGKYILARTFLQHAIDYDPLNAALLEKMSEIDYAELEKIKVQPILDSITTNKMSDYLVAIYALNDLINQNEKQAYVQKLNHVLADIRVKYALYLYDHIRNDEAYRELRTARHIDDENQNLHLALAKIQASQGDTLLAKLEEDRAHELAQQQTERDEALKEMLASVQEAGCDDIPSSAYWQEQERLAALLKAPKPQTAFAEIQVAKEISILLQAYNAGPGAVVVYDGAVPYRETVNYVKSISGWMNHLPESKQYEELIKKYSQKYNLDRELVRALIKVESDFDPKSHSKADARGLMQLTATTWKDTVNRMGVNWSYSKYAYDPEKNIEVGCHYLAWLKNEFLPKFFNLANSQTNTPLFV